MEKINEKQKRIISIVIIAVLIGILIYLVAGIVKDLINKKNTKKVNVANVNLISDKSEEEIEEDGEEIDITELEEQIEEETGNVETKQNSNKKTTTSTKGTSSKVVSNKTYYIRVNYLANVVTIYTKDSEGNYTIPAKAMICSTGTATPRSGTYGIQGRWEWLGLKGGVFGHYSTQITGNILFHSVPYLQKWNPGSLEYWEYDKLRNCMLCRMCKAYCCRCKLDLL